MSFNLLMHNVFFINEESLLINLKPFVIALTFDASISF